LSYKEFWWASALLRMDTRDAISDVHSRSVPKANQSIGSLVVGPPPEEVTTFNLVRRLVNRRVKAGGKAIALHSRPLEGGNATIGRKPSGCDFELAVEVRPGTWVDLALQAKKFEPGKRSYRGWNPTQNLNLIQWAATNGNRTPGMLLYNTEGAPFAQLGATTDILGGCCVQPKKCHGWKWPGGAGSEWSLPDQRTPMAVSLVVDKGVMTSLTDPTPQQLRNVAFPLECIFCPNDPKKISWSTGAPSWALELLETEVHEQPGQDMDGGGGPIDDDFSSSPAYSVVLGIGDQETVND